jgi:dihydroxyacetone kinase-like predicted kinase
VRTVTVPEGFAALLAHDPEADGEVNQQAMSEAVERVVSGEVTRAVRDAATTPAGPVRSGDWLGLTPGGIEVVGEGVVDAVCALLERLVGEDHEIVTLVAGEDASPDDSRLITEWLAHHRPHVTVESHEGGQPHAAYLLSAE